MKPPGACNPKKILIRGTNWVGDAVMSIPAMREVRRIFPEAHISLLVRPWVRDIYSAVEFVDEILDYDRSRMHRGLVGFGRLVTELRTRRFDHAILFQNAFEAALIAWCARIPERTGYARDGRSLLLTRACDIDPAVRAAHQVWYYVGILCAQGWIEHRPWDHPESLPSMKIGICDADRNAAKALLRSAGIGEGQLLIGLNPGAFYGEAKRWFPDRYAAVADALALQYQARILIFGSANDLPVTQEVAAHMKQPPIILAGRTTLGQLMGLIKECHLLVTNDSGPMHIAAALDVPQLALFGSTSEIATGPLSRNATVIKHQVACNPCFLRKCPIDFRCMQGISVRQVIEAAQVKLDAVTGGRA